jgi:hypothetical protein
MGYRFGLFNYSTRIPGGYVDFDWLRVYRADLQVYSFLILIKMLS